MSVELTAEAREAVRGYMLKLVAIPGSLLTLISLVAGYFIHDVGERTAYLQALQEASGLIAQDSRNVARALEGAELQRKQIDADAESIRALRIAVQTEAALVTAKRDVDSVANLLKRDAGFIDTVPRVFESSNRNLARRYLAARFAFERPTGIKLCAVGNASIMRHPSSDGRCGSSRAVAIPMYPRFRHGTNTTHAWLLSCRWGHSLGFRRVA
jgi:hypothetical protein